MRTSCSPGLLEAHVLKKTESWVCVCMCVCVHTCTRARAHTHTHTHRKTAKTLTSMPSLASIHRDPSTDGEMSRLNQADMEQTLEVRLENKNQNKKVIWDISGYVTQGRDFRE